MYENVFDEGVLAWVREMCLSDNPYNELSEEAIAWEDGWRAADNYANTKWN